MEVSDIEKHYVENRSKLVKKMAFRAGTPEAAEDIVQEAYYRAWKYYASFRQGENFNKWFSIILNNCLREYKNTENGHSASEFEEEEVEGTEPTHYNEHIMRDIYALIDTKSLVQQEVLTLFFKQEYSPIDISRITDYTYANCHQIIQRFRNELKTLYQGEL
jgi:RNA polymerase sigma factor (sigma-70 family)